MEELKTKKPFSGSPEKLLGFGIVQTPQLQIAKTVKETPHLRIAELRNREKKMLVSFPVLSLAEAQLVHDVLEEFQLQAGKKNQSFSLTECLNRFVEKNQFELENEQAEYLLTALEKMAFGFGALDELLKEDELEEIVVTGIGKEQPVRVFHQSFGWLCTNLFFSDATTVKNLVNKMARNLGRRLSMQTPRINAVLENGSRIHAVIEPVSFRGPAVTIRKFRQKPFSPASLLRTQTIDSASLAFLWLALQTDCTILVCGNTGSGKTTTLNALFCFVPKNERIIIVEETPEIRLPHAHQVKLTSSPDLGIDMHSLIVDSLRMRPDRIVVGEMRTALETKAFVDTLLAGQGRGSFATFHAQSTLEAINRMKTMGVLEMDLASIDLVVVQKRWTFYNPNTGHASEQRKIVEISELVLENQQLQAFSLVEFDFAFKTWQPQNQSQKVASKIMRALGKNKSEMATEIAKRTAFLESFRFDEPEFKDFFEAVNQYAFHSKKNQNESIPR